MASTAARLLRLERPGIAGIIGAIAAFLAIGLTSLLDIAQSNSALAIGLLTAILFLVLLVARNAIRLWLAPESASQ